MRRSLVLLCLAAALLCGCAGTRPDTVVAAVNERTGESFTKLREPLRLATTRPGLSVVGKDYLLVAPVMLAGSATGGQYLWFALGTTLDRPLHGAPEPGFDRIVLVVDDVPMTFDLDAWRDKADAEPYDVSMLTSRSFGSRITASQIRRIANAESLSAYVTNPEHRSPRYELVRGEPLDWLDF
ncbi:MAG: hypothetical protein AAFX56_13365 [Pseudomonadota bacterium]